MLANHVGFCVHSRIACQHIFVRQRAFLFFSCPSIYITASQNDIILLVYLQDRQFTHHPGRETLLGMALVKWKFCFSFDRSSDFNWKSIFIPIDVSSCPLCVCACSILFLSLLAIIQPKKRSISERTNLSLCAQIISFSPRKACSNHSNPSFPGVSTMRHRHMCAETTDPTFSAALVVFFSQDQVDKRGNATIMRR